MLNVGSNTSDYGPAFAAIVAERDRFTIQHNEELPVKYSETQYNFSVTNPVWMLGYDGSPFGIEILFIIVCPVWTGLILNLIYNFCSTSRKAPEEINSNLRPKITIAKLQQTKLEQELSGHQRLDLEWYMKRFVVQANDPYLDIEGVMRSYRHDEDKKKNHNCSQLLSLYCRGCFGQHSGEPQPGSNRGSKAEDGHGMA